MGERGDRFARRLGLSLVELLLVLAVIGVLIALVLPAVQQAREAARLAACGSNLRQIGVAASVYADSAGCFPPGGWPSRDARWGDMGGLCERAHVDRSHWVAMLPELGETTLYEAWNYNVSVFGPENATLHTARVATLVCPSDGAAQSIEPGGVGRLEPIFPDRGEPHRHARTSYVGIIGSLFLYSPQRRSPSCEVSAPAVAQHNGVFHVLGQTYPAQITDGAGHTIMVAERSVSLLERENRIWFERHAWWHAGRIEESLATAMYPPNFAARYRVSNARPLAGGVTSEHVGGVNALFADGSVRWVGDSVDSWSVDRREGGPPGAEPRGAQEYWINVPPARIWQAMATIGDGDQSGSDF